MIPKQEAVILREIGSIYRNCAERVAAYTRCRWLAMASAWVLIFLTFLFSTAKIASSTVCVVLALLGGFAGGISIMFAASAKQIPLFVRYTNLCEEELQKRLEELKGA